jgi:hypothetical protein
LVVHKKIPLYFPSSLSIAMRIFSSASRILLSTAQNDNRVTALLFSFQFLQDSRRFEPIFVPLFTRLKILVDELFKRQLSDYFSAVDIEERELVTDSVRAPLRKC